MATNDTTVPTPAAEQPAAARRARATRARARRAPRARRSARRASSTRAPRTRVGTTTEPVAVTPLAQAQQLAERAVLIPLGAALEARDRVAEGAQDAQKRVAGTVDELVAKYGSVAAVDRQLKRFERRGGRARTRLEREVRKTRTRLEREARHRRVRFERVVQNGASAGIKLVGDAQGRLARVA